MTGDLSWFVYFAGSAICVLSYGVMITSALRHTGPCNRVTWLVSAILAAAAFYNQIRLNNGPELWFTAAQLVGTLALAVIAFMGTAEPHPRFDLVCLALAVLTLAASHFTGPQLGIALTVAADFFGMVPTIREASDHAQAFAYLPWLLDGLASALILWAVLGDSAPVLVYPGYLLAINLVIVVTRMGADWLGSTKTSKEAEGELA